MSLVAAPPITTVDDSVRLLVPRFDEPNPEFSIVIPALNEESTIGAFLEWCHIGIRKAGIRCEILIIDSSSDATAERALAGGARVLSTPRRGLGRAYRDSIPFIRSPYVLMGDADCTYDFREIELFVDRFRQGYEFIMGSRFRGSIQPGSMPWLHQYLGTPVTTWLLNVIYRSRFSDIHCGMRGITLEALTAMQLQSDGWEYASEMVLRSVQMRLRTTEVGVGFLKDPDGRMSHHKRAGWLSPWKAAWTNIRSMLTHGAHQLALLPGLALLAIGVALTTLLAAGPVVVGPVTLSLYWMLLGTMLSVAGAQCFYLGCISELLNDYTGEARERWLNLFSYSRSVVLAAVVCLTGTGLLLPLVQTWLANGYRLPQQIGQLHHLAIAGLTCITLAFSTFVFTLVLHAVPLRPVRRPQRATAKRL